MSVVLRVGAAALMLGLMSLPTSAQDWTKPKPSDAATRTWETRAAKPAATDAELGAEAQRRALAKQQAWDRRMRATTRSICQGC